MSHLLSVDDLTSERLTSLRERTHYFCQRPSERDACSAQIRDKTCALLFFEPSTRTFQSHCLAAQKLGVHYLSLTPETSSLQKGEDFFETLKTFEAMGVNLIVLRHSDELLLPILRKSVRPPIVSAGLGRLGHPTQALIDLFTLEEVFDKKSLRIGIVGDSASSRVISDLAPLLENQGHRIVVDGPAELLLARKQQLPLDEMIASCDVLYFLRVQQERHPDFKWKQENYHEQFGLNEQRLLRIEKERKDLRWMHPGPVNIGVELCGPSIHHHQSLIDRQVSMGVAVRMGVLQEYLRE